MAVWTFATKEEAQAWAKKLKKQGEPHVVVLKGGHLPMFKNAWRVETG